MRPIPILPPDILIPKTINLFGLLDVCVQFRNRLHQFCFGLFMHFGGKLQPACRVRFPGLGALVLVFTAR